MLLGFYSKKAIIIVKFKKHIFIVPSKYSKRHVLINRYIYVLIQKLNKNQLNRKMEHCELSIKQTNLMNYFLTKNIDL